MRLTTYALTRYAAPCSNIAASFVDGKFDRLSQKRHPGWSRLCARVLKDGVVRAGDPIEEQPPEPAVS